MVSDLFFRDETGFQCSHVLLQPQGVFLQLGLVPLSLPLNRLQTHSQLHETAAYMANNAQVTSHNPIVDSLWTLVDHIGHFGTTLEFVNH